MIAYIPWIALAVALAALFLREKSSGESPALRPPAGAYGILTIVVVVSMFAAWKWNSQFPGLLASVTGFAIGAFLSALAYALRLVAGTSTTARATPIALAVAAIAFVDWLVPDARLAMVFGSAVAAWLLGINRPEEPNVAAISAAVAAAAIVACNELGARVGDLLTGEHYASNAGSVLGLIAALAGLLAPYITGLAQKDKARTSNILSVSFAFALMVGGAWLVSEKLLYVQGGWIPFAGGAFIALLVHWLLLDRATVPTIRLALAAIIWVGAATLAFALQKGFGMALTLLGAMTMLLLSGNRQALLSLGPLAALVFYRVFREAHIDASRALDIGQHYAMIGILIGAVLPVITGEWLLGSGLKPRPGRLLAGAIWILILASTPVIAAVLLGAKGVVGYVVGLGLAPVMEAIRGERSGHTLSLSLGLAAAMTLAYGWLAPYVELTREDKIVTLAWLSGLLVAAALVVAILSFSLERSRLDVKESA